MVECVIHFCLCSFLSSSPSFIGCLSFFNSDHLLAQLPPAYTHLISSSTMNSFNIYSTPLASTAYSSQYFNSLTFEDTMGISYPIIAPLGSVISWVFVDVTPSSADTCHVLADNAVPHINELLPIIQEAQTAYTSCKCSVYIHISTNGIKTNYLYHFSKVWLNLN